MIYDYKSLSRTDVEEIVKGGRAVAVLPIGAIEQHGPHLPVGTDSFTSRAYADIVVKKVEDKADFLVLPQLFYALSVEHTNYPATLALGPETLLHVLKDIGAGLAKTGITRLVFINGHGGNDHLLQVAAREIYKLGVRCYISCSIAILDAMGVDPSAVHADKVETSLMLLLHPELVHRDRITPELDASKEKWMALADMKSYMSETWYAEDVSVDGVVGEPTLATEEFGEEVLTRLTDEMAKGIAYVLDRDGISG